MGPDEAAASGDGVARKKVAEVAHEGEVEQEADEHRTDSPGWESIVGLRLFTYSLGIVVFPVYC